MTVAPDGRIAAIASCADVDRLPGVEFFAGILTPGFVNVHTHLELSCLAGAIPSGTGFAGFAQAIGRVRGRFDAEQRLRAVERWDARMWQEGIDAAGDVANGPSAFAVKARSRIVYRTFAEVFGLRTTSTEALDPLLAHPLTSLTPHSTYSVSDALFRRICREGDAPLSIHFLESPAEAELYARRGPLWAWYASQGWACDFLHYGSPAERIVACVPRDRSVILVHDCFLTQRDIDLIMNHFTAPVWWCLCPGSNRYIGDAEPPVALMRANGLNLCVGTDSLASNDALSMVGELRRLGDVPLDELLRWATAGGAAALGMADRFGAAEVGRRASLVLLEGVDMQRMRLTERTRARRIV